MNLEPTIDQGRNERCECGSGLKFKKCHGDPVKLQKCMAAAREAANQEMTHLIYEETKHEKSTVQQNQAGEVLQDSGVQRTVAASQDTD